MDKRMQDIYENFEKNSLGLDDTFQFRCRSCGKCCKHREDILLTVRDLYNIAKYLGRTISDIADRYCELYIGGSSRMPIFRLKPTGPERTCPLLRDRRCIVHSAKPAVCALFPLGRAVSFKQNEGDPAQPKSYQPTYFVQPAECGTKDQTHTVREWLEQFGLPVEDEFYELWNEAVAFVSPFFREMEALKPSGKTMDALWGAAVSALYLDYDTDKELIPQFRANQAKLTVSFLAIKSMGDRILGGLSDGE